jgi:hypothetical protein
MYALPGPRLALHTLLVPLVLVLVLVLLLVLRDRWRKEVRGLEEGMGCLRRSLPGLACHSVAILLLSLLIDISTFSFLKQGSPTKSLVLIIPFLVYLGPGICGRSQRRKKKRGEERPCTSCANRRLVRARSGHCMAYGPNQAV